jgi:hypothetical protein
VEHESEQRPSSEEQQFRRQKSGGYLDIVKKGYARDADSRQRSALVPAHCTGRTPLVVVRTGRVQWDRRLANRKPSIRVYLDATGLSIGGVHRAEKEQETGPRRKARATTSSLRWALLMRAIK